MKSYPAPLVFDGAKFAQRYKLDSLRDFWVTGGEIFVPDNLPDDPPIFEMPDPPKPSIKQRLDGVKNMDDLITILKERL